MTARFPLTLYSPSMSKPVYQHISTSWSAVTLSTWRKRTKKKTPTLQSCEESSSPLFSTALIHFSTKLGIVVLSCAHSVASWQPNTFSVGNKIIIVSVVCHKDIYKHRWHDGQMQQMLGVNTLPNTSCHLIFMQSTPVSLSFAYTNLFSCEQKKLQTILGKQERLSAYLWCNLFLSLTAGWDASWGTSSTLFEPSLGLFLLQSSRSEWQLAWWLKTAMADILKCCI